MFTLHVTYLDHSTSTTHYTTLEELSLVLSYFDDDDFLDYEIIKPKS